MSPVLVPVKTSVSNAGVWEWAFSRSEFSSRIQRCEGKAVLARPRAWSGVQVHERQRKTRRAAVTDVVQVWYLLPMARSGRGGRAWLLRG